MRAMLILSVLFLGACAEDRVETIQGLEGNASSGESLFATNCEVCHGPNGEGEGDLGPAIDHHHDAVRPSRRSSTAAT